MRKAYELDRKINALIGRYMGEQTPQLLSEIDRCLRERTRMMRTRARRRYPICR